MTQRAVLVTAYLSSPLATGPDGPTQLDALLEAVLAPRQGCFPGGANFAPMAIGKSNPAPPPGCLPIPLWRSWLGPWLVAHASSPILPTPEAEWVEYYGKKYPVEQAGLLEERERRVIATTNTWTKSYRLPLRVRRVPWVRWFAVAMSGQQPMRELRKELGRVPALGKKTSQGFGVVARWNVEEYPHDYSWFAPCDRGLVLMRPLPKGDWLPSNLRGYKPWYGACSPPYWHPERFGEIAVPC